MRWFPFPARVIGPYDLPDQMGELSRSVVHWNQSVGFRALPRRSPAYGISLAYLFGGKLENEDEANVRAIDTLHEMSFELGNRPVRAAIPVDGVIELRDAAG
jgi:hypothetical protein